MVREERTTSRGAHQPHTYSGHGVPAPRGEQPTGRAEIERDDLGAQSALPQKCFKRIRIRRTRILMPLQHKLQRPSIDIPEVNKAVFGTRDDPRRISRQRNREYIILKKSPS